MAIANSLAAETFEEMQLEAVKAHDVIQTGAGVAANYSLMLQAMGSGWTETREEFKAGREELAASLKEQREEMEKLEAGHGRIVTVQAKNKLTELELNQAIKKF